MSSFEQIAATPPEDVALPPVPEPGPTLSGSPPSPQAPAPVSGSYVDDQQVFSGNTGWSYVFPVVGGAVAQGLGAPRDGGKRHHKGVDIMAPAGTLIQATIGGFISQLGDGGKLSGMRVGIKGDDGFYHLYAHLQSVDPSLLANGRIEAGQVLGRVGSSGNASDDDPHLHYSINEGGARTLVDPVALLFPDSVMTPYGGDGGQDAGLVPRDSERLGFSDIAPQASPLDTSPELAAMIEIPELAEIILGAINEGIVDPDIIYSRIEQSDWFQTTEPSLREWNLFTTRDPAGHEEQVSNFAISLHNRFSQLGVEAPWGLSRDDRGGITVNPNSSLFLTANHFLAYGFTDDEINSFIAFSIVEDSSRTDVPTLAPIEEQRPVGSIGEQMTQIQGFGRQMLINVTDREAYGLAQRVLAGELSAEGVQAELRRRATTRYGYIPELVDVIGAGFSPSDYFSEHRDLIAQMLEVDPDSVNLLDEFSYALDYVDEGGNHRAMTTPELRTELRKDIRFQRSPQGMREGTLMGTNLVEIFGKAKF